VALAYKAATLHLAFVPYKRNTKGTAVTIVKPVANRLPTHSECRTCLDSASVVVDNKRYEKLKSLRWLVPVFLKKAGIL